MACIASFPPRSYEECRAILREVDMINPILALQLEFCARTGLRIGDAGKLKRKAFYINGLLRDSISITQSKTFNKRVTTGVNAAKAKRQASMTISITGKTKEEIMAEVEAKSQTQLELTQREIDQIVAEAKKASTITIGISDKIKDLIEEAARLVGGNNGDMDRLLFESSVKKGSPYSTQYINRILKVVAYKLKLNYPLSTHSFRKAFASFLVRAQVNLPDVRDALGHSSLLVTNDYLKSFNSNHEQIALKIDL